MALLILFTFRLDSAFDVERVERGRAQFETAEAASAAGDFPRAIEHYREALLHIRGELAYRRGLAVALYRAGRFQEAESQLRSLRADDPTDAVVNRLLARTAARDGRFEEAANYYRTAVYGRWPSDPERNRLETRLELVELLESVPGRRAVNELVAMLQEEPASPQLLRDIGDRLLAAGAPEEAAPVFESLVESGEQDPDLFAQLARAQFGVHDFAAARNNVRRALRGNVEADDLARLDSLLAEVLSLDPTLPRLRTSERLRRSRALLERTVAYVDACAGVAAEDFVGPRPAPALAVSATLARARELIEDERPDDAGEAVEARLMTAANLWSLREQVCTNVWDEDDALLALMRRLTA